MAKKSYFKLSEFTRLLSQYEVTDLYSKPHLLANLSDLLLLLNKVRELFDDEIFVNSWYRNPEHNRRVSGSPTSQHLVGAAVDIHPKNDDPLTISKLATAIERVHKQQTSILSDVNFGQVIIYKSFLHVGLCREYGSERVFIYKVSKKL